MSTGPDNYDRWLAKASDPREDDEATISAFYADERRDIGWGVCFLAIVLVGGVLLLNSNETLPPPCAASQIAVCTDRLPLR